MGRVFKKNEFPTTQWTLVEEAGGEDDPVEPRALNELLQLYLPALVAHLEDAWRVTRHQAEDYVQGFATDKVLQDRLIAKADRNRGKFRRFLCTSLNHYVASCMRRDNAKRRLPALDSMIPLDEFLASDDITWASPDSSVFDVVWVEQLIEESLRRLEATCRTSRRESHWAIFEDRVLRPHLQGGDAMPYEALVERLGFASPLQASNALLTTKRMFARIFRNVVQEYVKSAKLVDDEVEEVRALLRHVGLAGQQGKGASRS